MWWGSHRGDLCSIITGESRGPGAWGEIQVLILSLNPWTKLNLTQNTHFSSKPMHSPFMESSFLFLETEKILAKRERSDLSLELRLLLHSCVDFTHGTTIHQNMHETIILQLYVNVFIHACSCTLAMVFIASLYISQTQKSLFFEYLHGMDLMWHKDNAFLDNYTGVVITLASQQSWDAAQIAAAPGQWC